MLTIILITIQIVVLLWFSYWMFISLFGFGEASKLPFRDPIKRFVLIVPAHNEESVIPDLLDNLLSLDYPKHLYDICLVADNCSDRTAEIGREKGVIVLEHFYRDGEPKGKPHAMKYAFDTLEMNNYDAFCIFDADNLATMDYLQYMNAHMLAGQRVIQCYLDTKNPKDNFITLGYAVSYYMMNRSWQLAKSRLGLGNAIGGTGFCVEMSLLKEVGWTARSLTEDLEFTMQCLLKNVRTYWCHHAKVYDEKPTNFKISCVQRLRWARGHWDVCFKYAFPLLKKFVIDRDLCALDGALYLLNPGKVVIASIVSTLFYLTLFMHNPLYEPFIPLWVYMILILFNVTYIFITLKDSSQRINVFKAYASLLFMSYSYIPLFFWSLATFTKRVWIRTEHKKNANLDQMEVKTISA
jgi:cellulose synthase/poly-beta-1,6-N-acetylglucosamine synthase-like glycosyltransferase